MTGADAIRRAAEVDPGWARKEFRRKLILGGVTFGALAAIAVGVIALVIGVHNERELVKVQHSACQSEPAGAECQQAKAESSKAANLYVTCIPFHKAGYACPKPGSRVAERRHGHAEEPSVGPPAPSSSITTGASAPAGGGDAIQPPSQGTQQPSPHAGGGQQHGGGQTGEDGTPHPSNPEPGAEPPPPATVPAASEPPAQPGHSGSVTTPELASPEAPPAQAPEHPVAAGVGGVVEEIGAAAHETVETVNGVACGVTAALNLPCK